MDTADKTWKKMNVIVCTEVLFYDETLRSDIAAVSYYLVKQAATDLR